MKEILNAVSRGFTRMLVLLLIGMWFIFMAEVYPGVMGEMGAPLLRGFGLVFIGLAAGDFALRILQPHVDSAKAAQAAINDKNVGAGLVYLGRAVLAGFVLLLIVTAARAEQMPPNAIKYTPVLKAQVQQYWPEMNSPSLLASQVEQETCISLKYQSCWNPLTQLKTSREQGVGLAQLTRAFSVTGATRFDTLSELVKANPKDLKGLSWDNWQDPTLQLRALIIMDKKGYANFKDAATQMDQFSMAMAAYNGGLAGTRADQLSCRAVAGCNSKIWFGHVELHSMKSKTFIPGYGKQSPFSINRTYVSNIVKVRRAKYLVLDT